VPHLRSILKTGWFSFILRIAGMICPGNNLLLKYVFIGDLRGKSPHFGMRAYRNHAHAHTPKCAFFTANPGKLYLSKQEIAILPKMAATEKTNDETSIKSNYSGRLR
jgi:hypothetical protein